VVSVGIFCIQLFRFWQDIKGGVRTKDEWGNTIVIHGGNFAPYSFFHYIIINAADYEQLREPILTHEQAHIRMGHSWDLMLLQLVTVLQWFNPFVYLLGRDLKAVHEYEADSAVLNFGIDAKQYQLLLVTKAVGNRLQTVGNCLNHHSLKKRIKMMYQKKSNRWMMLKALFIIPVACFALYTFATPKADSPVPQVKKTAVTQQKKTVAAQAEKATTDDKIYDIVDVNAGFPGGEEAMYKWLADNLKYPKEAAEKKIQGRVVVQLVINKDGSFAEVKALQGPAKELRDEAVRMVKEMPKWNPAKVKGEVVRSRFNLPVIFRLN
jgi:TonB family protein